MNLYIDFENIDCKTLCEIFSENGYWKNTNYISFVLYSHKNLATIPKIKFVKDCMKNSNLDPLSSKTIDLHLIFDCTVTKDKCLKDYSCGCSATFVEMTNFMVTLNNLKLKLTINTTIVLNQLFNTQLKLMWHSNIYKFCRPLIQKTENENEYFPLWSFKNYFINRPSENKICNFVLCMIPFIENEITNKLKTKVLVELVFEYFIITSRQDVDDEYIKQFT